VASQADVRERDELREALATGIGDLGHVDIVVANAGILPMAMGDPHATDFVDAVDVDLVGVLNTVAVSIPHLPNGSSIVITGSTAGLMPNTTSNPVMGPGSSGYGWSKRTLVSYVEEMALHLAPNFIRVNAIHPTNVNTHLLHNDGLYSVFRPDLEHPTREDVIPAFTYFQAMPIPYVEPVDISNLVLFLASDEARYITGQQIRVDAGSLLKFPNGPGK
jgi:NAD(P)-dependent dehydrogenase (short-subunit alcohol dehydrogenase family)